MSDKNSATINHDRYDNAYIKGLLCDHKTFAMIGASAKTNRPSYFVLKYLLSKGFSMAPVNPGLAGGKILGQRVYANLADVPAPVEVVDIFRNSAAALEITKEAIALKDRLGVKVIWMQLGVRNDDAAALAEAAGLKVIMNRCPKIEYGRLCGESGWMGVNANMVSAKQPQLATGAVQSHVLVGDKPE